MSDRRCLVSICDNHSAIPAPTVRSLMEIGWGDRVQRAKDAHGFDEINFGWSYKFPRVDALRDASVELARDEKMTHILFLDADMTWPTDVLMKMLKHHDKGIVSGLYHLKGGDFAPVAMRDGFVPEGSKVRQYYHDREYLDAPRELRPQEVVGMGCTLIPMAVFEAIGSRPWFAYADDDDGWPRVSEDVTFCQRATAAGFGIWLDPTVKCGHVNTFVVTEAWHRQAAANSPFKIKTATEEPAPSSDVCQVGEAG